MIFNQELCMKRYGKKLAITPLKSNTFFLYTFFFIQGDPKKDATQKLYES